MAFPRLLAPLLLLLACTMFGSAYGKNTTLPQGTITTVQDGFIVRATMSNGDINVLDWKMLQDLTTLVDSLENNTSVKVVILESANPEFWISTFSLLPQAGAPSPTDQADTYLATANKITTLPIVFIAQLSGRARGVGNEIALHCDLRFATKGQTLLGNFEAALGLIPGGGGIQYLTNLIGRAKALEYLFTGKDVDAVTAEQLGWVNAALEPGEIGPVVGALAERIALFPTQGLAAIKQRVNVQMPKAQWVKDDCDLWISLTKEPVAKALVAKEMVLNHNESFGEFMLNEGQAVLELYE